MTKLNDIPNKTRLDNMPTTGTWEDQQPTPKPGTGTAAEYLESAGRSNSARGIKKVAKETGYVTIPIDDELKEIVEREELIHRGLPLRNYKVKY